MTRGRPFQPGQSGNPKGRPPKERALTDLLEKFGNKTVEIDGKKVAGKRILSKLLWELVIYGRAKLPKNEEGQEITMRITSAKEWLDIAKQIYSQIDGAPKGELDLTTDGEPLAGFVRIIKHEDDGDST